MIDEDELRTLGHTRRRLPTPEAAPRSAAEVLARGSHLRRRRRGLRAAGAGVGCAAAVAGLVAVSTMVGDPGDPGGDITTAASPTTEAGPTTTDVAPTTAPPGTDCPAVAGSDSADPGAVTDPALVPDGLRLLPTSVPGGGAPELSVHAHAGGGTAVPPGCPAVPTGEASWVVAARHREGGSGGVECHMEVDEVEGTWPDPAAPGAEPAGDVSGHPAQWAPEEGAPAAGQLEQLQWSPAPGVRALAWCFDNGTDGSQPSARDDVLGFARSVVPVAADDPRLPPLSAPDGDEGQGRGRPAG